MTDSSRLYTLIISAIHSGLELSRSKLIVDQFSRVEDFKTIKENNEVCLGIHKYILGTHNYETSWNQMANGINLFLESIKRDK